MSSSGERRRSSVCSLYEQDGAKVGIVSPAGQRVVRTCLAAHEVRNLELRELFDSADDDLPQVAALRIAREKELAGENRRLLAELAAACAEKLLVGDHRVVRGHWPRHDMGFLQQLAKVVVAQSPDRVALLAAGPVDDGVFLIVASEPTGLDLGAAGAEVAEILGGRGGGRAPFFQGKATALDRIDEAVEHIRGRL